MKLFITIILFALNSPSLHARTFVPKIAELCGVFVGSDTMETLERKAGLGLPQIGGHAHGGRLWRLRSANCLIEADAFHYNDRNGLAQGRVLDWISIMLLSRDSETSTAPAARLSRKQALFMGVVSLGMTRQEVLRALESKLPWPKAEKQRLSWVAAGFVQVSHRNNVVTDSWRAELRFKHNKLQEILIVGPPHYAS